MADKPMATIAVIPARGGSKRLPRKALIPFNGKPMIVHTIDAAKATNRFGKIIVSSDDDEILAIAEGNGVAIRKRPDALAADDVPTAPVLVDVLKHEESQGQQWDLLACLYATAPLRTSDDILSVIELIQPGTCDYAMAVCASDRPIHQALEMSSNGDLVPVWPEKVGMNSQDAAQYVFGNGSTYAVTVSAFLNTESLYGPGLRGHVMPQSRSVDLDTEEDLDLLTFYAGRQ